PARSLTRVAGNRAYLKSAGAHYVQAATQRETGRAGTTTHETANQVRVPVAEERLNVEKRSGQIGEVEVQKRVVEEQQTVPVELRREEVHVEQRDVPDRPLRAGEAAAFREETIRVPVRGEEA